MSRFSPQIPSAREWGGGEEVVEIAQAIENRQDKKLQKEMDEFRFRQELENDPMFTTEPATGRRVANPDEVSPSLDFSGLREQDMPGPGSRGYPGTPGYAGPIAPAAPGFDPSRVSIARDTPSATMSAEEIAAAINPDGIPQMGSQVVSSRPSAPSPRPQGMEASTPPSAGAPPADPTALPTTPDGLRVSQLPGDFVAEFGGFNPDPVIEPPMPPMGQAAPIQFESYEQDPYAQVGDVSVFRNPRYDPNGPTPQQVQQENATAEQVELIGAAMAGDEAARRRILATDPRLLEQIDREAARGDEPTGPVTADQLRAAGAEEWEIPVLMTDPIALRGWMNDRRDSTGRGAEEGEVPMYTEEQLLEMGADPNEVPMLMEDDVYRRSFLRSKFGRSGSGGGDDALEPSAVHNVEAVEYLNTYKNDPNVPAGKEFSAAVAGLRAELEAKEDAGEIVTEDELLMYQALMELAARAGERSAIYGGGSGRDDLIDGVLGSGGNR